MVFKHNEIPFNQERGLTVCVTCAGVGTAKPSSQKKAKAWKLLEIATESPASGARFVGQWFWKKHWLENEFAINIVCYWAKDFP